MSIDGFAPVHRTQQRELAEGVVEMVVAANDVRDAHVVIVDDDAEHIGRRAVAPEQDEIVEFGILDGDVALHLVGDRHRAVRSEEHTSELQSLMRISYAVFCLKKKNKITNTQEHSQNKNHQLRLQIHTR